MAGTARRARAAATARRAWPRGATPRPRSRAEAWRTPFPRGGSEEELPHIRGLGQRPRVPGGDGAVRAGRSFPASAVGGGGREELPLVGGQGRRPGGAAPRPRPGAAAGRSFPASEARGGGREELPSPRPGAAAGRSYPVRGQGRRLGGAAPYPRSAGCTGAGGPKELFHVQGREGWRCGDTSRPSKEQRLRFVGGTLKRYPTSKVRETHVNLDCSGPKMEFKVICTEDITEGDLYYLELYSEKII